MIGGGEMFPMEMKEVGDPAVNRDETLTLARRFEGFIRLSRRRSDR
ncbi:hypothetical protein RLEG12_00770 (plasmid) [Rhizobium leguminosarum bv. trifolii CB782]|nr:hypothetical protein RLEG12_00770 [Rhizobium leguminosarum bv. trifolii CB782]